MKVQSQPQVLGVLLANTSICRVAHTERCLKKLMGKSILSHIIEHASPQVSNLILNANGDPTRFHDVNLPIVPDAINDHPGVLSGILTAMEWAHEHMPECEWIASFATRSPLIPETMVKELLTAVQTHGADMAYVSCNGRKHPEFGLWPVELAEDLRYALEEDDITRIEKWCELYNPFVYPYTAKPIDPFSNTNLIDGIIGIEIYAQLH